MTPREQHLATRRAAGLFDFSFMGLFEFQGEPRQSRDLSRIEPGRAAYTLLLNDDGSVFNDATVWNMGQGRWWLFTGRPRDIAWFGQGARDRSGEHAILALQGPESGRILARLIGEQAVRGLRYFRFTERNGMIVARLGFSGELGYELIVPRNEEGKLRDKLREVPECSFEAANTLRIEAGYVLFDREIDGRANPAELGLERLVSKPKEFPVSRRLAGLEIGAAGSRTLGTVTSECDSPTLGRRIALGFVPPDARAAHVVPLPFYDTSGARVDSPL